MPLTETLGNVGNPYQAVDPGQKAPGFLGGLADLGKMAINGLAPINHAAEAAAADKAKTETAANAAVMAIAGLGTEETSPDITSAAKDLSKMQGGVSQGKTSSTNFRLKVQTTYAEVLRLHPEKAAVIAETFKKYGIDMPATREMEIARKVEDLDIDAQNSINKSYIEAATRAGLITQSTPVEEQLRLGQQVLHGEYEIKLLNDRATSLRASTTFDQTQADRALDEDRNTYVQLTMKTVTAGLNPIIAQVSMLAQQAVDSPEGSKLLMDNVNKLPGAIAATKAAALDRYWSQGKLATPEGAKTIEAFYDNAGKSFTDIMTGDLAQIKTNALIVKGMEDQLKINSMQAMPLWNMFKQEFGPQAMAMMFSGSTPTSQLSPETQKAIKDELSGINPGSLDGMMHVRRVGQILRGELKIESIDPAKAAQTLKDVVIGVAGNRDAINSGDKSEVTANRFVNGLAQAIVVAGKLNPSTDMKSQVIFAQINSIPAAYNAAIALTKNPATEAKGQEIIDNMREGAAHAYDVANKSGATTNGTGIQKIEWDNKTSRWAIKFDRKAYDRYAAGVQSQSYSSSQMGKLGTVANVPSFETMTSKYDPKLADKVFTMNSHLHLLVTTAAFDVNVPKGATPVELSRYYGLGQPMPSAMKAKGEQPKVPDFAAQNEQLSQAISGLTTGAAAEISTMAQQTNEAADPIRTAIRVALAEDAANPVGPLSTIINRSKKEGKDLFSIISAPNQFEAYGTGAHRKVTDAQVEALMKRPDIQAILSGNVPDKYKGVTNFYSPALQSQLGRPKPSWDTGKGFDVGGTRYFQGG